MQKKTTFSAWLSTFVFCFLFWLLLTWSVHPLGLLMDAIFSAAVAAFTAKFFIHSKAFHFFNPITSNYDSLYVKKVGITSYEVPDLFFL